MPFHKVHQYRVVLGRYYYDDVRLLALLNVLIAQAIKYSSQFDMKYQLEIRSLFQHPSMLLILLLAALAHNDRQFEQILNRVYEQ